MKNWNKLFFIFFLILITSCNYKSKTSTSKALDNSKSEDKKRIAVFIKPKNIILRKNNLQFLKKFNNQYSFDFEMLKIKELKERITLLVGEKNFKFMDNLTGSSPVKIKNNRFSCRIYKAHDGCCNNSITELDFNKNILYVGICRNLNYKLYSEDGSSSKTLKEWCFCD
jgi:hypothetical protein